MSFLPHLIFFYVSLVMPWVGRAKYARLKAQLAAGSTDARLRFYRRHLAGHAALGIAVLLMWLFGYGSPQTFGLCAPRSWGSTLGMLSFLFLAVTVSVYFFRYRGDKKLRRLLKIAGALLPISPTERHWFVVVMLSTGIFEELMFRGFLFSYLARYTPRLDVLLVMLVSSLIFGLCHVYQGPRGVLLTTLIGLCLSLLYIWSGSLLLPMAVHAAMDVRLVLIFTPLRLQSLQEA